MIVRHTKVRILGCCFVGVILFGIPFSNAWADLLYFRQGGKLQGRVKLDEPGAPLAFSLVGGGEISVSRDAVKDLVREDEYAFYLRSGDYWMNRGDRERALLEYHRAETVNPGNKFVIDRIDRVRIAKALEKCNAGLEQAEELMNIKSYWQAIEIYEQILPISPTEDMTSKIKKLEAHVYAELAYLYFNHIYNKGAQMALDEAMKLDPDCALIYYVSGRMRREQGQYDLAMVDFQKALALDGQLGAAQDYILDTQRLIEKKLKLMPAPTPTPTVSAPAQ